MAQDSQHPERFRIGPEQNGFIYKRVAPGVWRCERASEESSGLSESGETMVLWLRRVNPAPGDVSAVRWVAYDARLSDEVPEIGDPIFSSTEENVLSDGLHVWILCKTENQSTQSFWTTVIPAGNA